MSNLLQKASIITTPTAYDTGKILSVKPVQYYGPELVTNGDFQNNVDSWSNGNSGVNTWVNGHLVCTGTGSDYAAAKQIIQAVANKKYLITAQIARVSGSFQVGIEINDNNGSGWEIIGSKTTSSEFVTVSEIITTNTGTTQLDLRATIFNISVDNTNSLKLDNVSVKEVINADFDFTRNSSATRVGSNGLIQDVASNLPRIDYTGGVGSWKFEPQRTNLVTYSEDFSQSYWSKTRATITSNQIISPDGTLNADLLTATDTSENYCQQNVSSTVSGSKQTASFFVKKGTSDFCHILLWDVSNDGARQWFDLTNGFKGSSTSFGSGISVDSSQMINYGNGWYKCIVVFNNSNTTVRIRISASNYDGNTTSSVGKTIYIYGAQLEVGSYPTSYIVSNSGSATTRLADVANNAGSSDLISSTEGVLYAEISALADDGTSRRISISDGSTSNRVSIEIDETADILKLFIDGNVLQVGNIELTNFTKICGKYKANDYALWVNGFKLDTLTTSSNVPSGLDRLNFDGGNLSNDFYGNTKCVAVFKEALTDLELECLVSWMSFSDLGINFGYTVE